MLKLITVVCVLVLGSVSAEKARFDNYRLYNVKIQDEMQMRQLQELDKHLDGFQLWDYPSQPGMAIQMLVPPHKIADFAEMQELWGLEADLLVANIQENIDNEQPEFRPRAMSWDAYYDFDQINNWFDEIAAAHSDVASVVVGGSSYEGRQVRGIKISYKSGNPGVFIEGGTHAREWISVATSTYILNELLTSTDSSIRNIAENYDWYIFPMTNPDGYQYTHTTNRLWRKTRSLTSGCYGADPNRNWGYNWMQGGASDNPCSDTFAGSAPFSEIETSSLSAYYATLDNVSTYISFHSYGQMLLVPFGHTTAHLGNYDDLIAIGTKALAKLKERHGTSYTLGNIAETIYIASGGSIDWIKGDQGTGLVYCYELRDLGANGFTLPASQIIPTGQETLDSIVVMLAEGAALGYH